MAKKKTFKGYFNYYLKDGRDFGLKSFNFKSKTQEEVDALQKGFQNPKNYTYIGEMIVADKDIEVAEMDS